MKARVLGIGSALVDILIRIKDDEILNELNIPKASMQIIDEERSAQITKKFQDYEKIMAPGGSAANTIHGLAKLGIETGFISYIGKDNIGSTGRSDDDPATTYMSGNVTIGDEFDFEKLGTVGENNMEYKKNENPMFVNPSIGDYRIIEGKGFYDIPYEKIGRY